MSACVLGSSIICADLVLRPIYRKDFQIVRNNDFLSASLCLSAGVMVSILPGNWVGYTGINVSSSSAPSTACCPVANVTC